MHHGIVPASFLAISLGCFAAGCGGGNHHSTPTPPLTTTQVAFQDSVPGSSGGGSLRLCDPAGNSVVDVSTGTVSNVGLPHWTPDAATLFFQGQPAGSSNLRIYQMSPGSSAPTLVNTGNSGGAHDDKNPVISPDGTVLVFESNRGILHSHWHLYAIRMPDGLPVALMDTTANVDEMSPSFSPDGKFLVYESGAVGSRSIMKLPIKGSSANGLAITLVSTGDNATPVWSTRGSSSSSKIAFARLAPDAAHWQIFFMDTNGNGLKNISSSVSAGAPTADDSAPSWSPDDSMLVFVRNRGIWRMQSNGTDQQPIVDNDANDTYLAPAWSPFPTTH